LLDSNDHHKNITESAGGITVSQSLGVDPSVDSLALEDYDHIEPVERLSWSSSDILLLQIWRQIIEFLIINKI